MLGSCSGCIAGLVAITPAAGTVGPIGALVIGIIAGIIGLWGVVVLKRWLKVDDVCDVFGIHGTCVPIESRNILRYAFCCIYGGTDNASESLRSYGGNGSQRYF